MTGQVRRSRFTCIVLLVALAVLVWLPAPAQAATLRLRLLSTTDIHTHVVDYDYYRDQRDISLGLARTAALIRQARGEVRNSLLFDSGDLIQGNPLGDYVAVEQRLQPGQVHPVFKAMNQLDYAAATLGNHEFNYGLDFLRTTLAGARFPSYFALVQDDPSVQLVARAQTAYVRQLLQGGPLAGLPVLSAAAPFKAGGRGGPAYYTDVPAGDIAIRNVADLYLYPNTVRAVRVSGAILREWLEMSAGQFNRIDPSLTTPQPLVNPAFPTFNYDVIDGVTYRIDVTRPARYTPQGRIADPQARRIVDLRFQGQPVTDTMELVVATNNFVATNNYRASGGGNFPGMDGSNIVLEGAETNQEIIKDWLIKQRTVDAAVTPIWSFVPIAAPVQVVFESSPEARSLVGDGTRTRHIGEGQNGFGLYSLVMR